MMLLILSILPKMRFIVCFFHHSSLVIKTTRRYQPVFPGFCFPATLHLGVKNLHWPWLIFLSLCHQINLRMTQSFILGHINISILLTWLWATAVPQVQAADLYHGFIHLETKVVLILALPVHPWGQSCFWNSRYITYYLVLVIGSLKIQRLCCNRLTTNVYLLLFPI